MRSIPDETFHYQSHLCHQFGCTTSFADGSGLPPDRYRRLSPTSRVLEGWPGLEQGPARLDRCPYCSFSLLFEAGGKGEYHGPWSTGDERKVGGRCTRCSWWYVQRKWHEDNDNVDHIRDDLFTYESIICRFPHELWREPLEQAERELREYRRRLSDLSPKDVEVLVGKILCQYYQCDVRHAGRAGDKGIDLILLQSDAPIAVQVKHRDIERRARSESVAPVREFVGAMVGEGYSHGIFVTTDDRYSEPAQRYAERVRSSFAPLNLMTVREVRDFMGLIAEDQWSEYGRVMRGPTSWKDRFRYAEAGAP